MLARAAGLLFGGGLTVTGSHHLCGDYLFSGHTIVLVISYLTIKECKFKFMCMYSAVDYVLCFSVSTFQVSSVQFGDEHIRRILPRNNIFCLWLQNICVLCSFLKNR